jgi:epoxyqueuosine reductase
VGLIFGTMKDGRYLPSLVHRLLKPKTTTGNQINGLGETAVRRARPIYHWVKYKTPFRRVQSFFYNREMIFIPAMRRVLMVAIKYQNRKLVPIAVRKPTLTQAELTRQLKAEALRLGADVVGITAMSDSFVYEGEHVKHPTIIMLGVRMTYERLKRAPQMDSAEDVLETYNRGQWLAMDLADWIRTRGYDAEGQCGPLGGPVLLVPAALLAGLGELGKHGSLINREIGANMRLAYVLTDMPLDKDEPDHFKLDDFCVNCQLCTTSCPPQAIFDTKQIVRGVERWYVNFDACVPYFNDTYGCGICLSVCPWTRPNVAPSLAQKKCSNAAKGAAPNRPARAALENELRDRPVNPAICQSDNGRSCVASFHAHGDGFAGRTRFQHPSARPRRATDLPG